MSDDISDRHMDLLYDAKEKPGSKDTSPLRLVKHDMSSTEEIAPALKSHRVSNLDFSYLSSQISPTTATWSPTKDRKKIALNEFVDNQSIHSRSSSVSQYNGDEIPEVKVQGMIQEDTNITSNLTTDQEDTNNSSTFMNSSIPTQELREMRLNHSEDEEEEDESYSELKKNTIDDDATPIVNQQQFSTPKVDKNTFHENIKLSQEEINQIFDEEPNSPPPATRIQSVSSSIYSAVIPSNNRVQSTTSSVYSEIPPRPSLGIKGGLKSFRISGFKPTLHKHLSQPISVMEEEEEQEEEKEDTQYQNKTPQHEENAPVLLKSSLGIGKIHSISENEVLDFTNNDSRNEKATSIKQSAIEESKPRVSVLNQSIFQSHYESLDSPASGQFHEAAKKKTDGQIRTYNDINRNIENFVGETGMEEEMQDEEEESFLEIEDEEDASALFVTSIYAFNANTLESNNDSSICLSFDQDEIAFTCNLDDSGWGEVTLLSSLKRGWVPMNYFRSTVVTGFTDKKLKFMSARELTDSRTPLRLLLRHAGTFLLNPQSKPVYIEGELRGYTFDVECFNGITDGLRKLLIDTDCISRSNSVVQNKPVVRKIRKKLLRGWADLIGKGKDYMGTVATTKVEYLQLLTFHLLQKAVTFLDIWGLEMERIKEEEEAEEAAAAAAFASQEALARTESQRQLVSAAKPVQKSSTALRWNSDESINLNIIYLSRPPILSYRINEIYEQLTTYLCLIAGRIDIVEHNPKSFSMVGVVVGHINLLVNEYFFIIRLLKSTMNESETENRFNRNMVKYGKLVSNVNLNNQMKSLDVQTTKLRQMVEELNTYIRILYNASKKDLFNRTQDPNNAAGSQNQNNLYFYSREGGAVVVCACKMIELSSNAYYILRNTLNLNDESILPMNRKYPNYLNMAITPAAFLETCSAALVDNSGVKKQVSKFRRESLLPENINAKKKNSNRASMRYSTFKTGNSTDVQLSSSGLDFLSSIRAEGDSDSPFLSPDEFAIDAQPYTMADLDYNVEDELIRGKNDNKIIGASFKALVHLLTDETNPPEYFFVSTFLLTFRIFADSAQLLEALIRRFDPDDLYKTQVDKNTKIIESMMRSRRKLIAKFFKFWLESYWNSKNDYVLLAPLINYFNEGMRKSLPIESSQLLVIASKLIGHPPIENTNDRLNFYNNFSNNQQLLPRKISSKLQKKTVSKMSLGADPNTLLTEVEAYNAFLEDIETYDLEKIENDPSTSDGSRVSLNLSLNIELKNSSSNTTLLTKQQQSMINMVIMSYRRMLGTHWYKKHVENQFEPLDTKTLIESWWNASQESWKILNDDLTLLNFNGLEIAKQLTLIESKLFCSIQVGELLNQNFTTKKLHLNLSPNIQKSILFTNLLSDYVIESILKTNLQMRQRIHAFKCWLKIGISCLYLRNFNSLASIMTSLQSFLITRIEAIWDGLSEKYKELFNYLASIIHPNKNYKSYRERLKDFLATNLQESLDIPTVPYLSLFLQDLTFIVDGNPNYRNNPKSFLEQKLINIDKYIKITQIISEIQTLQISYRDIGELGVLYNDRNTDIIRSETIKNLKNQLQESADVSFDDMFDITGAPTLQELILLEIWKVKQTNARDDDRSWKLSCAIQPREYDS